MKDPGPVLYPSVRFPPGFAARIEALVPRLTLARERGEGLARAGPLGMGVEFVGHRPYRRGDDPRGLDWSVMARMRRPWVRVLRREAGERWLVWLDTSASMGVGPPGKLQRAAEVAAGLSAVGLRLGARVRVVAGDAEGREVSIEAGSRARLGALLRFLEARRAGGAGAALPVRGSLAGAGRVFVVGDLLGASPQEVLSMRRPGREWALVRILAPHELAPRAGGAVEWWDPEGAGRLELRLDEEAVEDYERALSADLEAWRGAAARGGMQLECFASDAEFEDILARVLLR